MKRWKSLFSIAVMSCMILQGPIEVAASLSEYDGETAAKLQDNKMEFDELQNLIKEYNPNMKSAYSQIQYSDNDGAAVTREIKLEIDDLKNAISDLKNQRKELVTEAKRNHNENSEQHKTALAGIDKALMEMDISLRTLYAYQKQYTKGTEKGIEKAEKGLDTSVSSLTQVVQGLLITYNNLVLTQETLKKTEELQEASLEAKKRQVELGMATETEVLSAQSDLSGVKSSLEKLGKSIDQLRSQLCIMTGWAADATPEMGAIPTADATKVAAMDLARDTIKAIGNNQTLISEHRTSSKKTTVDINNRLQNIEEIEQKLKIEMERQYQDVQAKKIAYDGAMAAFEKAKIAKESADRQYQMGMISKIQYLAADLQFTQANGARGGADMALFQSMLNYDWAVKGFVTIPES